MVLIKKRVIDYIIVEDQYKHIPRNSRTYQGTLTTSDHRILITTMQINWSVVHTNKNRKSNNKTQKFNTQQLVNDKQLQEKYKHELNSKITIGKNNKWDSMKENILETAANVIGYEQSTKRKTSAYSSEIESLSKAQ